MLVSISLLFLFACSSDVKKDEIKETAPIQNEPQVSGEQVEKEVLEYIKFSYEILNSWTDYNILDTDETMDENKKKYIEMKANITVFNNSIDKL